jgi:hypothetical protein
MTPEELAEEIKQKNSGYPWRPLAAPSHISRRPVYQSSS